MPSHSVPARNCPQMIRFTQYITLQKEELLHDLSPRILHIRNVLPDFVNFNRLSDRASRAQTVIDKEMLSKVFHCATSVVFIYLVMVR